MRVTILGSGSATGTPAVGRGWGKCDPDNPRNRRLRPSILVEDGPTAILVDTSPDLRQQLLNADVSRLDAVLFTHYHADHVHGIDDLRPINRAMEAPLDVYADAATMAVIGERFGYVFEPLAEGAETYYKPTLVPRHLIAGESFAIDAVEVTPFEQWRNGLFLYGGWGGVAFVLNCTKDRLGQFEAHKIYHVLFFFLIQIIGDSPPQKRD